MGVDDMHNDQIFLSPAEREDTKQLTTTCAMAFDMATSRLCVED